MFGKGREGAAPFPDALLLVLGAPFLGANWGFPDDRVLPESASARQLGDQLPRRSVSDLKRDTVSGSVRSTSDRTILLGTK